MRPERRLDLIMTTKGLRVEVILFNRKHTWVYKGTRKYTNVTEPSCSRLFQFLKGKDIHVLYPNPDELSVHYYISR